MCNVDRYLLRNFHNTFRSLNVPGLTFITKLRHVSNVVITPNVVSNTGSIWMSFNLSETACRQHLSKYSQNRKDNKKAWRKDKINKKLNCMQQTMNGNNSLITNTLYGSKDKVHVSHSVDLSHPVAQPWSRDLVYINTRWHHLFTPCETRLVRNRRTPLPNGDWHGKIGLFRGSILRSIWLLQSAWILVSRWWQREIQERNRAEHQPPLPRRAWEEDSREIPQQRNETQENQELVVLMAFPDVDR